MQCKSALTTKTLYKSFQNVAIHRKLIGILDIFSGRTVDLKTSFWFSHGYNFF